jgi:hypothetical protein
MFRTNFAEKNKTQINPGKKAKLSLCLIEHHAM